jgi:(2R)-phospho-3-sulfolactate synthase (ComA)
MNHRPAKPRRTGVTEIRGPYYTPMGRRYLEDVLETMGPCIDSLKFAGGSFTLMPQRVVKELIDICHRYDVLVSTGGFLEYVLAQGPAAVVGELNENPPAPPRRRFRSAPRSDSSPWGWPGWFGPTTASVGQSWLPDPDSRQMGTPPVRSESCWAQPASRLRSLPVRPLLHQVQEAVHNRVLGAARLKARRSDLVADLVECGIVRDIPARTVGVRHHEGAA